MKKTFWKFLALLGFWVPVDNLMPEHKHWVIVALRDDDSYFLTPRIAQYNENTKRWQLETSEPMNDYTVVCWHRLPKYIDI